MSIFILRASKPLAKGVPWHVIPHLKDENDHPLKVLPTTESIKAGHLEWPIPDISYNRVHIKQYYSNFEVIEADEWAKPKTKEPVKLTNKEVGELKAKLKAELTESGIIFPKNSSLEDLKKLVKSE